MAISHLSLKKIFFKPSCESALLLDDLSLEIADGEFVILLGSNGSGKSSLLKVINGLVSPSAGALFLQGLDLSYMSLSKRSQHIVTLTQDLNLSTFSNLTVLENCRLSFLRNKQRPALSLDPDGIGKHLHSYNPNLSSKLNTPVYQLSGGERQTLALAMSLWVKPSLLLLDEHTSALDPVTAKKLMALTHNTAREHKITTLMATHNLQDALQYGTRLIVMKQGKLIVNLSLQDKKNLSYEELVAFYNP